jgi:hypothetical protein
LKGITLEVKLDLVYFHTWNIIPCGTLCILKE